MYKDTVMIHALRFEVIFDRTLNTEQVDLLKVWIFYLFGPQNKNSKSINMDY